MFEVLVQFQVDIVFGLLIVWCLRDDGQFNSTMSSWPQNDLGTQKTICHSQQLSCCCWNHRIFY